jgi:Laminin G domain
MVDSSGNGINGSVGSAIQTGVTHAGATGYRWSSTNPNGYPAKPERLVTVPNDRLNPGSRDYAVTVRFRTTHSYGNMIQKGQSESPGGFFKWQIPSGRLMCLYRSRDRAGNLLGQKAVTAPVPLNDGAWHTVRCEKTFDRVTMTIDGTTVVRSSRGTIGPIANTMPLSIGGKVACDQVEVTCDYFAGDIDWVRIDAGSA